MLRNGFLALLLAIGLFGVAQAQEEESSISVRFEDINSNGRGWATGTRVYVTNNEDFALCYHPELAEFENVEPEWVSDVIRLEPDHKEVFVGRVMMISAESWRFVLGGRLSTECL